MHDKNTGLGGRKAPPPVRVHHARKAAGSAADNVPLFSIASVYISVSGIYNMGKNEGQRIEIEHIKLLELQRKDSINLLNDYDNGTDE